MKKLLVVFLVILLVGCNTRAIEFERTFPDTSEIDSIRAEKKKALDALGDSAKFDFLIGTNTKPPKLSIYVEDFDKGFGVNAVRQCWAKTLEECSFIEPTDVFDMLGVSLIYATVPANRVANVNSLSLETLEEAMPTPDKIDILVFHPDGTYTEYPSNQDDAHHFLFTTPAEGTTKMFFRATYTKFVKGVALYPFVLTVTDNN